ncbi:hypothetical protein A5892_11855 [Halotalea alkalilenta]|uniref:Murein hydrolase transporter LrgA n=2 Tax=Halotalea alkalilenta TaxID=376489 RepID=A0A172YK93_9GAMM|nr:hypothetical protein A5892_11855 [Halotalea alkalilenta]
MPLLVGMSILLGCQLIGEGVARAMNLPVPGPVIGMVLLLVGLMLYGKVPEGLRMTTRGLTQHLALLFVPAGVGVMVNWPLISQNFVVLTVTLLVSTVLLQVFMVLFMRRTLRGRLENHDADPVLKEKRR